MIHKGTNNRIRSIYKRKNLVAIMVQQNVFKRSRSPVKINGQTKIKSKLYFKVFSFRDNRWNKRGEKCGDGDVFPTIASRCQAIISGLTHKYRNTLTSKPEDAHSHRQADIQTVLIEENTIRVIFWFHFHSLIEI